MARKCFLAEVASQKLQDFLLQIAREKPLSGTKDESLQDAIGLLLTREPNGCDAGNPKKGLSQISGGRAGRPSSAGRGRCFG